MPTLGGKRSHRASIPVNIPDSLLVPEFRVRGRNHPTVLAFVMHVPEAAVHENHLATPREHKVRPTRQPAIVQDIAIAHRVKQAPDRPFRAGVLPAYRSHVAAALHARQNVHQVPFAPSRVSARTIARITGGHTPFPSILI